MATVVIEMSVAGDVFGVMVIVCAPTHPPDAPVTGESSTAPPSPSCTPVPIPPSPLLKSALIWNRNGSHVLPAPVPVGCACGRKPCACQAFSVTICWPAHTPQALSSLQVRVPIEQVVYASDWKITSPHAIDLPAVAQGQPVSGVAQGVGAEGLGSPASSSTAIGA